MPYQAFGSVAITYSKCSTRKEIKHNEHPKRKWFANQHEPVFCRRHSPFKWRQLRRGFVFIVFIDHVDGFEPAAVGTRGGVVVAGNWQHVVEHGYVRYYEHDGCFELVKHRDFFYFLYLVR
jgi:hypothetical protein